MRHLRTCFYLVFAALGSLSSLWSQAASADLPSDATGLMTLAHEKNGLEGPGVRPWHIHGTYHLIGKSGQEDDAGIFEEWWISSSKYKRVYAGKIFSQIEYADGQSLSRAGSQEWPPGAEMMLRGTLIDPLPGPSQLKDLQLVKQTLPVGQTKLECVAMTYPVRPNLRVTGEFFPRACFDSKLPVLRIYYGGGGYRVLFDQIVQFQGHFLAKQIRAYNAGELFAELSIDSIENLANPSDSIVESPAEAKPVDLSLIVLKEDNTRRFPGLLKKAIPDYPEMAKSTHTQGTVVIHATVGPDGRLSNLKVVSGSPLLQNAALEAVAQWVYRPFEVMGEARSVQTEIKVIFSLG